MAFMKAELFYKKECILGEGPVWDHRSNELLWIDIDSHQLYFLKDGSNEIEVHNLPSKVGFVTPCIDGAYIAGIQEGLHRYHRSTRSLIPLHHPESDKPGNRWNDGKCNPDGTIWCGTMSIEEELHKGGLYRLGAQEELNQVLSKISISNGLAWNPDLGRMYYIDSPTQSVQVFDYKPGSEVIVKTHEFSTDLALGYPDGMTIDEDGMLWVAQWDGHCIARYHPETGQLITKVEIPAPRVTSCCFGGKDMSRLFVTTARTRLTKEQLEKYPLSGSVFVIDTNTKGLEVTLYGK